jgi:3-dehydroquinate dehydratase type I
MICVPVLARDTGEAIEKIQRANPLADLLELRIDGMVSFDMEEMISSASKPVIATYRSEEEGGEGSADHETVIHHLLEAIKTGAGFLDLEYRLPQACRDELIGKKGAAEIILSAHLIKGTPPSTELEDLMHKMAASGADILKIVTLALAPEDNLRVLNLIPLAQKLNQAMIAFCMGPMGRISRIASPILGGYLTFASLEEGEESAHGQIPVREMRRILSLLSKDTLCDLTVDADKKVAKKVTHERQKSSPFHKGGREGDFG